MTFPKIMGDAKKKKCEYFMENLIEVQQNYVIKRIQEDNHGDNQVTQFLLVPHEAADNK